jgi:hypothetical protein
METTPNKATAQEAEPMLHLDRSLLAIDEYAAREGLSRGLVEECGKLGILQIRKCRGKTFVVDVPLSPYRSRSEGTKGATKSIDGTNLHNKISDLGPKVALEARTLQKDHQTGARDVPEKVKADMRASNEAVEARPMSSLVEKMRPEASQTTGKPMETLEGESSQAEEMLGPASVAEPLLRESVAESSQASNSSIEASAGFRLVGAISRRVSAIINKLTGTVSGKFGKRLGEAESRQIIQDDGIRSDSLVEGRFYQELQNAEAVAQAGSKRTWQVVTLFLIVFLFAALAANIWLYRDRQVQLKNVDIAQANTQIVYKDYVRVDKQAKTLGNELAGLKAGIERIQNELADSRAAVTTVRNELADARANLKTIQRRHAQAVGRVNEEMRKLIAWLREPNKSTQSSSGSITSDQ